MKRGQSSPLNNSKKSKQNQEENVMPIKQYVKIDLDSLKKVTVFEDRAELRREFTVMLEPGPNEVIVERISNCLKEDSVRVTGKGDAVIEEVQVANRRVVQGSADSERAKRLRSEKEILEKKKKVLDNEKISLKKRIEALDAMIGQVGSGIAAPTNAKFSADRETLESVTSFFDFYDQQVTELREKLSTCEESYDKVQDEIKVKSSELRTIQHGETIKVVSVLLDSTKGGHVDLQLTYQVANARWCPFYDLRVDTTDAAELQLSYYGSVSQTTGEDWEGAHLTLSTARPCLGGNIPDLNTLDVVINNPPPPSSSWNSRKKRKNRKPRGMDFNIEDVEVDNGSEDEEDYDSDDGLDSPLQNRLATVHKQTLSTEFTIARLCSIPSDKAEHKVTIGIVNLQPQLVHVSVPSKNACAFLTASAVNSSSLPLLKGDASVYLDGAYVSKTTIMSVSPGEHFIASLGVDPAVKIEYKPAHKHHEEIGMFAKLSTTVTEQKIVVRNTREDEILLTIREQIPRSTDEKIKVNMIYPTEVEKMDDESNQTPKEGVRLLPSNNLEWTIKMDKGQSQTLLVKYSIEHSSTDKIKFIERKI